MANTDSLNISDENTKVLLTTWWILGPLSMQQYIRKMNSLGVTDLFHVQILVFHSLDKWLYDILSVPLKP